MDALSDVVFKNPLEQTRGRP